MRSPPTPRQAGARRGASGVVGAAAVLACGPVVLAFASGGYFDGPRLVALVAVAGVLGLLALTAPAAALELPGTAGRCALGGFALLTAWVALSRHRSALPDVAGDDAERVLLYTGFLAAGAVAWRRRATARLVEPAVAAGILVVLLYGLAGRWVPGVLHLDATASAGGRLEQPLTYWNATGMLAAVGLVLCARVAGDPERAPALRAAGAAGAVPLLCGVYLSFSRGAAAALLAGLLVLLLCAPTRRQVRAVLTVLAAGVGPVVAAALLPGVRGLEGGLGARERDGLIALGATLVAMAAAAALTARGARRDRRAAARPARPVPRAARWAAAVAIAVAVVGPVLAGREASAPGARARQDSGASAQRFTTVSSNRYAYWRVALDSVAEHPVAGVGSGGWAAEWLRRRRVDEGARDAHSIELETLGELGIVGFGLLLAAFGGVAASAAELQRRDPGLAAGACAGLTVWLAHASLDWDWELPAATLPALSLAGLVLARAPLPGPEEEPRDPAGGVDRVEA